MKIYEETKKPPAEERLKFCKNKNEPWKREEEIQKLVQVHKVVLENATRKKVAKFVKFALKTTWRYLKEKLNEWRELKTSKYICN